MIKGPIQPFRVFKPIAANKTLVESWTFRLVDAPDMLLERTLMYNRLINAPTSVVGHDDLEMYERAQKGLQVTPINGSICSGSTTPPKSRTRGRHQRHQRWQMRNQFRAWSNS